MARCTFCGRWGLPFSRNKDGLCGDCAISMASQRQRLLHAIMTPADLLSSSRSFRGRLFQCDVIIEHARALLEYEKKGIAVMTPLPSEIVEKYANVRKQVLANGVKEEVETFLQKARQTLPSQSRVAIADEALLKIYEARKELGRTPQLDALEKEVSLFVNRSQFDSHLETARNAELKGEKNKALDHYLKALELLRRDGIVYSLPEETVLEIQGKVSELRD